MYLQLAFAGTAIPEPDTEPAPLVAVMAEAVEQPPELAPEAAAPELFTVIAPPPLTALGNVSVNAADVTLKAERFAR